MIVCNDGHFEDLQGFTSEVLYAGAGEFPSKEARLIAIKHEVHEPFRMERVMEPDAMQGLLKIDGFITSPDGASTRISTLANQNIAFLGGVSIEFIILKAHFKKIAEVKFEPADINIPEVHLWGSLVLAPIEHFPQAVVCKFADRRGSKL
ncbi:MAG: hypothetical protein AUJ52_14790 [Elusimicrobia bacterium CG1_02_63_36]|nr:MAG: hypothetical protein AUJ52_14790 [Elusimicrobia bacterium CG1_02_63_36]